MMLSKVEAMWEKSRVLLVRAAQNNPVVMFPRKMTTELMCRGFQVRRSYFGCCFVRCFEVAVAIRVLDPMS